LGRFSDKQALVKSLSILDRLLALFVLLAMILGVVIGVYAPNVQTVFNGAELAGTPIRTLFLPAHGAYRHREKDTEY
jgi:ACR3 family arsenite efflux pump ArsB